MGGGPPKGVSSAADCDPEPAAEGNPGAACSVPQVIPANEPSIMITAAAKAYGRARTRALHRRWLLMCRAMIQCIIVSQVIRTTMPLDNQERQKIAHAVRSYIAKERISREEFAQRAKLGKSTVDKLVIGLFSEKTILQVESQLNINVRLSGDEAEFASEDLGKYTREDTARYIGEYVFARPSFREEEVIYAFRMEIGWDRADRALVIKEKAPDKKTLQFGKIHIPRASMHIFISSNQGGWLKNVILSQVDIYKRMKGLMLTMGRAFGNVYAPMAVPVIMNKYDQLSDDMIGAISPGSRMYEEYKQDLLAVEQERYARWVTGKAL